MPSLSASDYFTAEEIAKAERLHAEVESYDFATRCADEIVTPALGRINEQTGQENDARYFAYMLQLHVMERKPSAGPTP